MFVEKLAHHLGPDIKSGIHIMQNQEKFYFLFEKFS